MKRFLTLALALAMLLALAVPAQAAEESKVYLKGSGKDFTEKWQNVFTLGGAESAKDPSVWHLVYTGAIEEEVTSMQITFTNKETFNWDRGMGFSTNGGGKNPGWVIIAPSNWEIACIDQGNNNESNSFLVTTNPDAQFNISGYHKGTPDDGGDFSTEIAIMKFINNIETVGEGFIFDVFPASGPFDSESVLGTMISDEAGLASHLFDPGLEAGDYIVRERPEEGFAPVDDLKFTVDEDSVATFENEINYIININLGALEVTDDVVEEYYEEYHKPVYKMYTYGTLVSHGNTLGSADLPDGITGDLYLKNGMTYLKINKAALEALGDEGATIGIAESNKPGKSVSAAWNTPVAGDKSYNLKIVDGKLVVSSDLPGFGAAVYASNSVKGPQDIKHNDVTTYDITTDKNGDFWFFFHIGAAEYHLGEVIGCEIERKEGPFERLFGGEVTMTVTDAADVVVYNGSLGLVEDLLAGDYTVTIFADGVELATKTVTVLPGETTNADFGKLTVPEKGENVIFCDWCNKI